MYGSEVAILRDGKKAKFQIVAHGDVDIDKNRISYESPLAKVILGLQEGFCYEGEINGNQTRIEILEVNLLEDRDLLEN